MKLGLTFAERRRRNLLGVPYFAFLPVHLDDGRWAWLELVNRFRGWNKPWGMWNQPIYRARPQ